MRRLVLALIVVLSAPASAGAQERLCKVTGPEARAEATLREEMRYRRHIGFRADRAYVAKFDRLGVRLYRRHGIRVTSRGGSLPRSPLRSWGVGAKGGRVSAPAPGDQRLLGGSRRLAARAVRGRVRRRRSGPPSGRDQAPGDLPARDARRARALQRPRARNGSDRIHRDARRWRGPGSRWSQRDRPRAGSLGVDLVTRRTDHARYFAAALRPDGQDARVGRTTTSRVRGSDRVQIAPDGMSLTVSWRDAPEKPARIEVTERADRVAIGVVDPERLPRLRRPGRDRGREAERAARRPPRVRRQGRRRMLQTGPSPGDPPCPVPPAGAAPLEAAIAERARYGMNTDPAYVQSLLDRGERFTPHERSGSKTDQRVDSTGRSTTTCSDWREDWGGTTIVATTRSVPTWSSGCCAAKRSTSARSGLAKYPTSCASSVDRPARLLL